MQTYKPIALILLLITASLQLSSSLWAWELSMPAARACIKAGGVVDTVTLEEGEMSVCIFDANGMSVISSWALVHADPNNREEGENPPEAVSAFFSEQNKIPTDRAYDSEWRTLAAIICTKSLHGEVRETTSASGRTLSLCFFAKDQSAIGVVTLFYGTRPQGINLNLVRALNAARGLVVTE